MIRSATISVLVLATTAGLFAQEPAPSPPPTPATTTTAQKRGWLGRMLHPFSSSDTLPKYNDRKLNGLVLELGVSPQPVKLSEVRQLEIKATLSNRGKRNIQLDFPTDQRVEIFLLNSADVVLTKWSDNHAISPKPGTILINPGERVEYKENIATRELSPNKVFVAEVFFPQFPELRIRQKFLTEP